MTWAYEERLGFDLVYRPGSRLKAPGSILTIETDAGVKGEVPGGIDARAAQYLLGRNPLERDKIWHDLKRSQRGRSNGPPGAVDVALWDIAGKLYDAPIHELLGGWRMKLPCYASTYHGDENGGLTRAEDYGDFALRCKEEYGYPAFKIHGWIGGPIEREAEAVLATRKAVGDGMALMLDPAGAFETFDDVLRVGRACDEARFFWYEDAFRGRRVLAVRPRQAARVHQDAAVDGRAHPGPGGEGGHDPRPGDRLRAGRRRRGRGHHRGDEDRRPGRGARPGRRAARPGPGPPPLHGRAPQQQLLRAGPRPPQGHGATAPRSTATPGGSTCWTRSTSRGASTCPTGPGLGVDLDWDFITRHKTGEVVHE